MLGWVGAWEWRCSGRFFFFFFFRVLYEAVQDTMCMYVLYDAVRTTV
jgi:hypothetical protein